MREVLNLGQVINLEENKKAKNSEAYARWIKIHNLKIQAKTFSFMSEHGLLTGTELDEEYANLTDHFRECRMQVKEREKELKEVNRLLRLLGQYFKEKVVYGEYYHSGKKPAFREAHQAELSLYESASKELREIFGEEKLPSMQELKARKALLQEQKEAQYAFFKKVREQWMELGKVIRNRDSFLAKFPELPREEKKPANIE